MHSSAHADAGGNSALSRGDRHPPMCEDYAGILAMVLFRVIARGKLNSCLIEFLEDGWRVVTSRNALRKA